MRVLICADAFKDAADAPTVCRAIADGIRQVQPTAHLDICPLADGGEGTARILTNQLTARWVPVTSLDPLGRPITSGFGWLEDSRTAFLDMAETSGLQHLAPNERNPLYTSTFGTGQLLRAALDQSPQRIYLGIGGSATNDGGMGMAAALGYRFFVHNQPITMPTGRHLAQFTHVEDSERHPLLAKADIRVLCDVGNPLLGELGATRTYGPQKGASPDDISELEKGLHRLDTWWEEHFGRSLANIAGSGAAGGLGAGLMAFCGARLVSGAETIFDILDIRNRIRGKTLVISGEGHLDHQTLSGKLIGQLAQLTTKLEVPLVVLCGQQSLSYAALQQNGIQAAYTITPDGTPLPQALRNTPANLSRTAVMVSRHYLTE